MDNIELGRRYDGIIERCVAIFEAKTKDYGPTWLFVRDESFVDQLWIKARRIRTLEENGTTTASSARAEPTNISASSTTA